MSVGSAAGWIGTNGYWCIGIDGRDYLAHRLAWLYVKGTWPADEIDHRDGNPANCRWNNLRPATSAQNKQNRQGPERNRKHPGPLGVTWQANRSKWKAQIGYAGKNHHLGLFASADAASAAYLEAKRLHHPHGTL